MTASLMLSPFATALPIDWLSLRAKRGNLPLFLCRPPLSPAKKAIGVVPFFRLVKVEALETTVGFIVFRWRGESLQ